MAMKSGSAGISRSTVSEEDARRLRRVLAHIGRQLRRSTAGEIPPTQVLCLMSISADGPLRIGELAARERINPTALSRVVAKLQAGGYIKRCPDPDDGRGAILSIAPRGKAMIDHVLTSQHRLLFEQLQRMQAQDAELLIRAVPVLESLVANWDESTAAVASNSGAQAST